MPAIQLFDWPRGWPNHGFTVTATSDLLAFPPAATLKIRASDVARSSRISTAFANLQESGFDLALDLYTSHLHRSDPREAAVDIAIALENLYLQKQRGGEYTYRFSIHVAAFARRLAVADRISRRSAEKLYGARSNVVHGSKPLKKQIELLNTTGASLVRSTLIAIASSKNRETLQNIGSLADDLVSPSSVSGH